MCAKSQHLHLKVVIQPSREQIELQVIIKFVKACMPHLTVNAQHYLPQQAVPQPNASSITPEKALANCQSRDRTVQVRIKETLKTAEHRLSDFLSYADQYQLPFTLAELKAERDGDLQEKYEEICSQLDDKFHRSRPFSAQYFDKAGEPLFFYFGVRWADDKVCTSSSSAMKMLTACQTVKQRIKLTGDFSLQYKDRSNRHLNEGIKNGRIVVQDGIAVSN